MSSNKNDDELVLKDKNPCEVCKDPDYLGNSTVYGEIEYCGNCGRILSYPCGDYIEEDYYGDDPGDY